VLDRHILPTLGNHPIGANRPSIVATAVASWSQTLAPGTVGQVLRQVRQILDAALADGLVASNAAKSVKAPTAPRRRDVHRLPQARRRTRRTCRDRRNHALDRP
jgi:hypothetical protein